MNGGRRVVSRRAGLASVGAGMAFAFTGCSLTDENDNSSVTSEPDPAETPELSPTPTQEAIASPIAGYSDPERWRGRTLTVATWGGDYQDAQRDAFFEPFAAATGATVQDKVADLDSLRSQVEDEDVVWDVLTVPMEEAVRLGRDGVLEPMNYDVVDRTPLYDDIVLEYGVGVAYFSATINYPANSQGIPQDWSSFWNAPPLPTEGEPEPAQLRCLRRNPIGTLEFALLADGVQPAELYPLDTVRAFASLDQIREHVLVWWQESKEPSELVAAGAVGMASGWNVRIPQLDLTDEVRIQWYGGMLSADAWVVPRGTPNSDVAFDFINYATRAVPNANFSILVPYGPVNTESFNFIRNDRLAMLPSSPTNKPLQFVQGWNYWSFYEEPLTIEFEEWLLASDEDATPETE